jgi:hypothetical protein
MKTLLAILLVTFCAATGYGQTVRTLVYNSTNGQIVAATNVVWTNAFSFSTNVIAAQVRTNLGLEAIWLTNTSNVTAMRALAGSTNTNEPVSGAFEFKNAANDVFIMTVSNGIILSVVEQ